MLTCVPLWAILITQCGQSWAFYTQLTELPTYMSEILHFNIQQVCIICSFLAIMTIFYVYLIILLELIL